MLTTTQQRNMKCNKLNLVALMALSGLVAFGPMANAQEKKTEKQPAKPKIEGDAKPAARRDRLSQMAEQLNLTAEQQAKIKPILQDEAKELKALRDDTGLSPQDRRGKVQKIREATNAKIKPILTAEQAEKLAKLREQAPRGRRQQ